MQYTSSYTAREGTVVRVTDCAIYLLIRVVRVTDCAIYLLIHWASFKHLYLLAIENAEIPLCCNLPSHIMALHDSEYEFYRPKQILFGTLQRP